MPRLTHFTALILSLCLLCAALAGCGTVRRIYIDDSSYDEPGDEWFVPDEDPYPVEAEDSTFIQTEPDVIRGIVIVGDALNVRSGPGTGYTVVDSLGPGDEVVILSQTLVGNVPWGETGLGWICLDYVRLDDPEDALTSYVAGADGLTIRRTNVYEGPGDQYESYGGMSKNTRVSITRLCSNFGWTGSGWICLDDVYFDGTVGPDAPRYGTVKGIGVNIRSGPGTQYNVLSVVNTGDPVTIYYQADIGSMTWGCSDIGWICMDYVVLDSYNNTTDWNDQQNSEAPDIGMIDPSILGTWECIEVDKGNMSISATASWVFRSDGSFENINDTVTYYYDPETGLTPDQDPMKQKGSQIYRGTYTYDGYTLNLTITFIEWEDGPFPEYETITAVVDGDMIYMTRYGYTSTLYKTENSDYMKILEELAEKNFNK